MQQQFYDIRCIPQKTSNPYQVESEHPGVSHGLAPKDSKREALLWDVRGESHDLESDWLHLS